MMVIGVWSSSQGFGALCSHIHIASSVQRPTSTGLYTASFVLFHHRATTPDSSWRGWRSVVNQDSRLGEFDVQFQDKAGEGEGGKEER